MKGLTAGMILVVIVSADNDGLVGVVMVVGDVEAAVHVVVMAVVEGVRVIRGVAKSEEEATAVIVGVVFVIVIVVELAVEAVEGVVSSVVIATVVVVVVAVIVDAYAVNFGAVGIVVVLVAGHGCGNSFAAAAISFGESFLERAVVIVVEK
jgi:hypothetical protein